MNDEETDKELENFWGLLKENQVIVPLNLKHILSTNNLVGIRVMAEINDEVIKELESSVREMGNVDIASKMSEEDKVKLFGPIYKLCPDKFKFSIGDKMVLRVIQKVSKELEASFKVVTKIKDPAPTIKDRTMPTKDLAHTEGQQHTSSVANSRPKPSNEEIRALEGRLEDCILRWGKRKNMECENQFRVAGNTVTCKFKTSASTFCNKTYKLQQSKEGSSWQISNFTNHINAEHNKTKKVSTASPTTNQNQEESTAISTPNSGNEVSRKRKSTTSVIDLAAGDETNDSNGDDGSGYHSPSEISSPSNDNGNFDFEKGKSTAHKHRSKRSNETSMLPSSLNEEDNSKSM
ncbi:uncharacterized protein LOC116918643 isoform X1 [Daphnia magna]|uniref:uncharacterized protein LOC123467379 isoform X1 n=1 Tax=Daphnia magna TaxID=35525 RepID=UPI001E1BBC90|nr:uncharacterized protein LOC123467379 isoform X1 [Daphnia magna]XP_045028078.1 uncharacterized protein LOC116918643 isoform X1 [Daphnia magna]